MVINSHCQRKNYFNDEECVRTSDKGCCIIERLRYASNNDCRALDKRDMTTERIHVRRQIETQISENHNSNQSNDQLLMCGFQYKCVDLHSC